MKKIFLIIVSVISMFCANAQIGYQVSLLNNATGEPRSNETVAVTVSITNSEGAVVCTQSSTETTNDFGILSVEVGNSTIFSHTDWTKLPFYVEATVDGILVGKSQLLSVPVSECAKNLVSCKDKIIGRTFKGYYYDGTPGRGSIHFEGSKAIVISNMGDDSRSYNYVCYGNVISGNFGTLIYDDNTDTVYGSISNGDYVKFGD